MAYNYNSRVLEKLFSNMSKFVSNTIRNAKLSSEISKEGELSMLPELCRSSHQVESFKIFLIFLTKTDLP